MEKLSNLSKTVSKYLATRDYYLSNAEELIKQNNLRKASELLWGAVTQTIKGLAYLSGIPIYSHNGFRSYIREISKEIDDRSLFITFTYLENLHRNFYDEEILEEDFPDYYKQALLFMKKLDGIAIDKIKKEETKLKEEEKKE